MANEGFGYFRFEREGKVHCFDERPGKSRLRTLCGRYALGRRLIPADIEEAKRDLSKPVKSRGRRVLGMGTNAMMIDSGFIGLCSLPLGARGDSTGWETRSRVPWFIWEV